MKGFGIEVKNNLLEQKHIDKMGISVWLYMWCLDKMTSISEEGIGLVLSGRAIRFEEVSQELGVSQRTYERWVKILKSNGYINTERSTFGLKISVNKAHKYFGKKTTSVKSDVPQIVSETTKMAHQDDKNGTSSINNTHNNTIQAPLPLWINKNAWGAWEKYNRERKKRLTPSTREFQIRKLAKFKTTHAEMIYQSIEKNWLGLFPIGNNFGNGDAAKVLKRRIEDQEGSREREASIEDDKARSKIDEDIKNLAREKTIQ